MIETFPSMCSSPGVSQFDQSMFAVFGLSDVLERIGVDVQQTDLIEFFLSNEIVAAHCTHQKSFRSGVV